MFQRNQTPQNSTPQASNLDVAKGICFILSYAMIVLLRVNLGVRAIHLGWIFLIAFFLFLISPFADSATGQSDLIWMAGLIASAGIIQKFAAWRKCLRGEIQNSRYIGDSHFRNLIKAPAWPLKNRRLERFFDPLLPVLGGVSLVLFGPSRAVGCYLTLSGLALRATEDILRRAEIGNRLDIQDALIRAQAQSAVAEQFVAGPVSNSKPSKQSGALATGVASDIAADVAQASDQAKKIPPYLHNN